MSRATWVETGRQLGARYAEHAEAYAEHGYTTGREYRLAFVKANWPKVGERVRRWIREGFAEGEARARA